jgi:hypothetical protein
MHKGRITQIRFNADANVCNNIKAITKPLEELGVMWKEITVFEMGQLPKIRCEFENRYGFPILMFKSNP